MNKTLFEAKVEEYRSFVRFLYNKSVEYAKLTSSNWPDDVDNLQDITISEVEWRWEEPCGRGCCSDTYWLTVPTWFFYDENALERLKIEEEAKKRQEEQKRIEEEDKAKKLAENTRRLQYERLKSEFEPTKV